jgi:hypothetical protein
MSCSQLAEYRVPWRALVNTVMPFTFLKWYVISVVGVQLLDLQDML